MRLICPNCDAQYEVDAALIPASGRDVQCSNCGKTWFQEPEGAETRVVAAQVPAAAEEPEPEAEPEPTELIDEDEGRSGDGLGPEAAAFFGKSVPEVEARDDVAPEPELEPEPEPEPVPEPVHMEDAAAPAPEKEEEEEEEKEEEVAEPARERPRVDPSVLGILRAEAEREIAARRAEAQAAMETQPDLGLAEPEEKRERTPIEARTARLRGEEPEEAAATGGRRTLLPDIDEINSTLTATSDREVAMTEAEVVEVVRKQRSGFRIGFSALMLVTAALILTYLFAPQIAATVPALEPVLAGYVDWANGIRQGIDGYLERSVDALTGLLIRLSS